MARTRSMMMPVALAALAALGAKPSAADGAATETTPAPAPPPDAPQETPPSGAEIEAQLLRERVKELEAETARQALALEEMRAAFDLSWASREREIEERYGMKRRSGVIPEGVLPPTAPVRGKVQRFAAALIHCHAADGSALSVRAGDPIPDGAVLDGVHPSAIEER